MLVTQFLLDNMRPCQELKIYEEPSLCLQQPLFCPREHRLGRHRRVQQEGRVSQGGKSCPGHAGSSQMPAWWCPSVKPPESDSSLRGSWVVTQPKRRRRRMMCGAFLPCPPAVTVAAHTRMAGASCPAGIYCCPKARSLFGSPGV